MEAVNEYRQEEANGSFPSISSSGQRKINLKQLIHIQQNQGSERNLPIKEPELNEVEEEIKQEEIGNNS